jgi:hypothetical protein
LAEFGYVLVDLRALPQGRLYLPNAPGITREGAEFLAKAEGDIIAADNHCLESNAPLSCSSSCSSGSGEWKSIEQRVRIEFTACHFGGKRSC